jgi:hypothetical protein
MGWLWIGQACPGDVVEGEEVGFVRVDAGKVDAGDAGGDAPLVDGGIPLVLDDDGGHRRNRRGGCGVCDVLPSDCNGGRNSSIGARNRSLALALILRLLYPPQALMIASEWTVSSMPSWTPFWIIQLEYGNTFPSLQ